jgi:uncharacterized protein YbjT (DUF2867 family)
MKIVIVGGTGLIGSRLVDILRAEGHAAVSATPASGVDAITGRGLAEAIDGAAVVVDVANTPAYEIGAALEFFTSGTHHLLEAEAAAGVGHHVVLSVVGAERLSESPYLRGKSAQEELTRESPIPHTIVQATQFFEFVDGMADAAMDGGAVRLAPCPVEPVAADDVAAELAALSQGPPVGGAVEIAGPDRLLLDQFVRHGLLARGRPRTVVPDRRAPFFGAELHDRILLPGPNARRGEIRFRDWLARQAVPVG